MRKISLFMALAFAALLFASCNKSDYKSFVGTWGTEKIEYYNINYAGEPIGTSFETITYDPNDIGNGIQLIFREDKSGEMRDNDVDTVWYDWNPETLSYDHYVVNPDTTLVYPFTFSYDKSDRILYMNMDYNSHLQTFKMYVNELTDDSFVYENEYDKNYIEKAYLKRLSKTASKSTSRVAPNHPRKRGSFLGGR